MIYDGRLGRVEISTLGVGIRAKKGDGRGGGEKPRPLPRPIDLPQLLVFYGYVCLNIRVPWLGKGKLVSFLM